jgi:hypothetical protein
MTTVNDLTDAGYPPERIARIQTECRLVAALETLDEAAADADGLVGDAAQHAVNAAIRAARGSVIAALRHCQGTGS